MAFFGTVALVTGANRGIGSAFVGELLARGANTVYASARNADSVALSDPRVVPVTLDVTDPGRVSAVAEELSNVSLVVNNAGVMTRDFPLRASLQEARWQIETNYIALISMTSAFAPVLARNDTDMAVSFDDDKVAPAAVARAGLDALEAGLPEVLVDDFTRNARQASATTRT